MTDTVTIRRELLERAADDIAYAIFNLADKKLSDLKEGVVETTDPADSALIAERTIRAALAAPVQGEASQNTAQPEVAENTGSLDTTKTPIGVEAVSLSVDGVAAPDEAEKVDDIFAWATFDGEGSYDLRLYEDNEGYLDDFRDANPLLHPDWVFPLCRLSDAQRAIAELREECKIHRNSAAGAHNQLRANRLETERLAVDWQAAVAERDTLRQQLAELRAQLLAIASAEPRRHTIEWAKAMAATGNNEAYAKWREAFDQRDKLAGLLADVKADYTHAIHWEDMHATMKRIDAALAEVKPCLESPAPTT